MDSCNVSCNTETLAAPKKRMQPDSEDAHTATVSTSKQKFASTDYTIGWICALSTEYVAAQVFLDERHEGPDYVAPNDNNDYTLGKVGSHNVVIAVLPDGEYGISSATGVAKDMLHSFPNIKVGLMVGIGGGAPSQKHDIRLGDVVVSAPRNGSGGVSQYDFGKAIQGGSFYTTGFLNQPPPLLRAAVNGLEAHYEINGHQLEEAICDIFEKRPRLQHDDNPRIHYGLIASANQVMKDALIRDELIKEKDVLCFDMEAAGLMNQFPCLVIRGICDYSDSHKSEEWQGYAAMTAAAYAKDLLYRIPLHKVEAEQRIKDVLSDVQKGVDTLLYVQQNKDHQKVLNWLTPIDYAPQQRDYISVRQPKTGNWFLSSEEFQTWINSDKHTLFCPGGPGVGKTIMAAAVIDRLHTRFLIVRLHIDSLTELPTVGHVKRALRDLPNTLGETYDQAMARIEAQGEALRILAKKVLSWLVHAKRVLSVTELQHAVAIEPGTSELDEEFIPDKEILVSICAGLVTFDTESRDIRLAHYTIQEYFEREGRHWFQHAETDIARACLTYLSFCAFESDRYDHETDEYGFPANLSLSRYAARHWGNHACGAPERHLMPLILDLLCSDAKRSSTDRALSEIHRSAIHVAVFFELESTVLTLIEMGHDVNGPDPNGRTPLLQAVKSGCTPMVQLLLRAGAEVDVGDELLGHTPLTCASNAGSEGTVKLLLEHGADVDYDPRGEG
ncbi:hypothetical protein MKX07_007297 [Trichoderma sp. CBMAI-0711]|nr:hypothetical protein MKX07_007297 [Trichoderma sp. CBMAI-0711]